MDPLTIKDVKDFCKNLDTIYPTLSKEDQKDLIKSLEHITRKLKLNPTELIFKFGKYKNQTMSEVPASYLLWCYEQDWFKENNKALYEYIKTNLKTIKKQKVEEDMDGKEFLND